MLLRLAPALASVPWWAAPALAAAVVAWWYAFVYLVTYRHLRGLPAPPGAQLSNLWLLAACRRGRRSLAVDEVHRRLGPAVRIQPNHVSIADEAAIGLIYGHGNGFLKSDYYDAFVAIARGLFNTRDCALHSRKRKLVSHAFSAKSVAAFEPYVRQHLGLFARQLDRLVAAAGPGRAAVVDALPWFNFLAFDIIGDLAFSAPFGMLRNAADVAEFRASPASPPQYASAVDALNRRGDVSATLGCLPRLRTLAGFIPDPFFSRGLAGIARVTSRLGHPPAEERQDLLARLMEGRDELTAEAMTHLIAGSDTTANASCALMFYLASNPSALRDLDYLGWAINEGLRLHATSGIGLPRQVPPGSPGVTILGRHYPPGCVLGVPAYTVMRSRHIWADDFRPDRWAQLTPRQKNAFIPFSQGPRACIGRNVAEMELRLITATWARRYAVEPRQPTLEVREGFLRKPLALQVALRRR